MAQEKQWDQKVWDQKVWDEEEWEEFAHRLICRGSIDVIDAHEVDEREDQIARLLSDMDPYAAGQMLKRAAWKANLQVPFVYAAKWLSELQGSLNPTNRK
jgi:hypothetical protein